MKKKWHCNNLTVASFKLRSYSHVIVMLKKQMKKMVKSTQRGTHGAYVNNPRYNLVIQSVRIFSITSTTYPDISTNRWYNFQYTIIKVINVPRSLIMTIGDFKSPTTRRQRELRFKNEFAFFQSLSQLFLLSYFVKCRLILLELNS